ncbi:MULTISPECIES: cupin domain-containing protein [unclassified Saccharopolyspora]|uniref:cupin domain-containing protein n=1 Tax=unclassified Saccharopolyspora TaxID=2646250 RepID=UPI001CD5D205|nr:MULTISPECIES: cupin domain-containing protein [unclassified Saccharopolyspora]MCA1185117.1 cupin domain-containing protein [Saccharopolyspora sp. 6T]MCA1224992.1 cupin domain-containing protein [Saccharopolyspora sp. 6M]MCA1278517.1 cupin domain-containing protein [Saccharopolyspora sp. 7B]
MQQVRVNEAEIARRTIRRTDFVSCDQAFIDCRTPGSERKENYAMIGPGVSQNSEQVINLREPHGYNIGAAAMPHDVTNNLHLHFTAEVFLCFRGEFLLRWGADGNEGELVLREGDIASIPTWIFRGFTNIGPDDGWLFTSLGHDDTGGIIWGPTVLRDAAGYGLHLTEDGRLIDTVAGDEPPEDVELVRPMAESDIARLRSFSVEKMRRRVVTQEDLEWCSTPFLGSHVTGGGAELALVVGFGMTEDLDQEPRIHNPHGHNIAWLRAEPGAGVPGHRIEETQVLMVKEGRWEVTVNDHEPVVVELGEWDMLSVPPGAWRGIRNVGEDSGKLVVINSGDGRVRLDWDEEVVKAAADAGYSIDHNGYVAPYALVPRSRG